MLASSVLVLTALTVTGVFVKRNNNAEREDYIVDFETIEQAGDTTAENMLSGEELDTLFAEVGTDDLDYDPSFQEANSLKVENTEDKSSKTKQGDQSNAKIPDAGGNDQDLSKSEAESGIRTSVDRSADAADAKIEESLEQTSGKADSDKTPDEGKKQDKKADADSAKKKPDEEEEEGMFDETVDTAKTVEETDTAEAISTTVQPNLDFKEEDGLVWPIVGDVLINYSMDKTVYFPTLEQYKYNPAIVIAAQQGAGISAAASGRVTSVGYDPVIGNTVVTDLGNGYELTYGQLENITVSEGSYVNVGDGIGTVASPTKYYSMEGTNVYFKLTKDGEPVNPMGQLQ